METDEMSEKSPSPTVDVDFLSRVPIFSSVNREDLTKLAGLWKPTVRPKGQAIFQKGDPPRAMYVIREGKVAISVWTEENLELVLSMLGKGDFFGELALLDGSLRTATAKVVEQADLLEMTQGDFLKFLRGKPEVALSVMAVIAQRLRTTNGPCQLICTDAIPGRRRGSLTSSLPQAARAGVVISRQSWNRFLSS
jgi:CRP-like cAMP-binding protein